MESISAIIFGLILMLPLLIQLQTLAARNPWKLLATLRCHLTEGDAARDARRGRRDNLVQYYPKLPDLLTSPDSESRLIVCAPRSALSSPEIVGRGERTARLGVGAPLARHSSSYVATRIELPVVDITCDYNACRYNTLESSLRQLYGANYPPGEVVLNYIQLSTPDSRIGIRRDPDDLLLDRFGESDAGAAAPSVSTRHETEYLNLLDHFAPRRRIRAPTAGKFTETLSSDDRSLEVSSRDTCSQSTLRGSSASAQEKESGTRGPQRGPSKGIEYGQGNDGGGANRRPVGSQRVLRRR